MKILYLTPGCFDKGGISRYSRYQITALRELFGADNIKVLSLLGPTKQSFEDDFQVAWHGSGNSFSDKVKFTLTAIKEAIFWRPEVVHTAHINFSGMAHYVAKLCGAKTILNTYGLEVWSGLSRDAALGLKKSDVVMSDCHYTANYLEDNHLRPKKSVEVIWDCVDLKRFSKGDYHPSVAQKYNIPSPTEHFIIMSLGRLSKTAAHKGYDRLIKVFSEVSKKYVHARLVIAGKGDNRPFLENLVEQYGLQDKVVFTGMVAEEDLVDLYRMADIFSLVSDRGKGRGEGIPLTPLEAMACATPVIVGNHDGSQEAVDNDRNGSIIDPFDFEKHAAVLSELIENPTLVQQKKEAAIKVCHERFSYQGFKEKHQILYQKHFI